MTKTTHLTIGQRFRDGLVLHVVRAERQLVTIEGKAEASLILAVSTTATADPLVQISGRGVIDIDPAKMVPLYEDTHYHCDIWESSGTDLTRLFTGPLYFGSSISPYAADTPSGEEIERTRTGIAGAVDRAVIYTTTLNELYAQTDAVQEAAQVALGNGALVTEARTAAELAAEAAAVSAIEAKHAASGWISEVSSTSLMGDGVTTVYTLAMDGLANVMVWIDGIKQYPSVYTLVGETLTFSEAPPNGSLVEILMIPSVGQVSIYDIHYTTVGDLLASTEVSRSVGRIWEAEGFRYEEVSTGEHVTTASGVKLKVLVGVDGYNVTAFGAKGDYDGTAGTDDTAAIQTAMNAGLASGDKVHFPGGQYRITDTISLVYVAGVKSFGFYGESGNSTRLYFENATALKDFFDVGYDVSYLEVYDLEFVDKTARTSRCFHFKDDRYSAVPSWKHQFRNVRFTLFKEGVRFDGGTAASDDAYEAEVLFLHSKCRNCGTGIIYNNIQAVNHQLIGMDFENDDAADATEKRTHIKFERGSYVNHLGGSVIGHGAYVEWIYTDGSEFEMTNQFRSEGVRLEKHGGEPAVFLHNEASTITVYNSFKIIAEGLGVLYDGTGPYVIGKVGGRSAITLTDCTSNKSAVVQGVMTTNLDSNYNLGVVKIENCFGIGYERVTKAAYGSSAVGSGVLRAIPATVEVRTDQAAFNWNSGEVIPLQYDQKIYGGGFFEPSQPKTFTFAPNVSSGFGSGSNPYVFTQFLPRFARPFKFRLLRDDVNASSPFELKLRVVTDGLAAITNCANNGTGLIRVTTASAHGLATGDGAVVSGVTGTTEANGDWLAVTVVDATNFDLDGSTFTNAYVSGGEYAASKTVSTITPTAGVGGHFEADIQTSSGLTYFINDGVNWDGKMKVVKSGTVNGYVGLVMIDYM